MKTNIDNFNINLIKGQTQILPKENKIQDTKTKKAENLEVSKLFEQSELIKSYPSFIKERKISNDSISICGSQAETLSQTSESSFFLSLTNQNKSFQLNSSNEIIQNEKKLEKNIPFYHGFEEYFLKLMPDKFSEYKNSKNFLPKNYFYKKGNNDEDTNEDTNSNQKNNNYSRIRNKEKGQSQSQNILQFTNCFYLPCFRIYCPINAYYINNFSTVIINNNNNNNNNNVNNNVNNNMNTNGNNTSDIDNNNDYINIIFILQYDGPKSRIILSVKGNESFGSVLTKLIEKTHNYDPHLYIFNGKKLNESKTIRELGILNNSIVYVVNPKKIDGGKSK